MNNRFSLFMIDYMNKKLSLVDNLLNTVQIYKLELVIFKEYMIIKEYNLKGLIEMFAHKITLMPEEKEIEEGQKQFDNWFLDYIKSNLEKNEITEDDISKIKNKFNANIVYNNVPCEFCKLPSNYVELYEDQNKNAYLLCPNCERDLSRDSEEELLLKILN